MTPTPALHAPDVAPSPEQVPRTDWTDWIARRVRGFAERVLAGQRRRPAFRRRTLPCELYLTLGWQSVPLFPPGPIDEFAFFQRAGVSAAHDTEFLARLDPEDAGTEDYKPYGVFTLRHGDGEPVPPLATLDGFWDRLRHEHGLVSVPPASAMASRRFTAYDPRYSRVEDGVNRIEPPTSRKAFAEGHGRRYSYAAMLEVLRRGLTPAQKIAWIEDAFRAPPPAGEIVHRYYMEASSKEAVLVRHHWARGKRLFRAKTNAEALQLCLASGHFGRAAVRQAA